ncbi:hypothetical protein HYH03_013727 [Edaphochlamys debaryana]|uniref:Uncharacterized protein n=1 Tax=Edaphochlamys debaryana TaxID=47281 RepID=A0A835XPC1_9CHLO|nr:hypothetical protein HYH03_013727 [Edaphochlamys debaryana]|eukprot:KAG2487728.1 hypothetical protein HYH03_013727 [Edaphochlamys debaryana]
MLDPGTKTTLSCGGATLTHSTADTSTSPTPSPARRRSLLASGDSAGGSSSGSSGCSSSVGVSIRTPVSASSDNIASDVYSTYSSWAASSGGSAGNIPVCSPSASQMTVATEQSSGDSSGSGSSGGGGSSKSGAPAVVIGVIVAACVAGIAVVAVIAVVVQKKRVQHRNLMILKERQNREYITLDENGQPRAAPLGRALKASQLGRVYKNKRRARGSSGDSEGNVFSAVAAATAAAAATTRSRSTDTSTAGGNQLAPQGNSASQNTDGGGESDDDNEAGAGSAKRAAVAGPGGTATRAKQGAKKSLPPAWRGTRRTAVGTTSRLKPAGTAPRMRTVSGPASYQGAGRTSGESMDMEPDEESEEVQPRAVGYRMDDTDEQPTGVSTAPGGSTSPKATTALDVSQRGISTSAVTAAAVYASMPLSPPRAFTAPAPGAGGDISSAASPAILSSDDEPDYDIGPSVSQTCEAGVALGFPRPQTTSGAANTSPRYTAGGALLRPKRAFSNDIPGADRQGPTPVAMAAHPPGTPDRTSLQGPNTTQPTPFTTGRLTDALSGTHLSVPHKAEPASPSREGVRWSMAGTGAGRVSPGRRISPGPTSPGRSMRLRSHHQSEHGAAGDNDAMDALASALAAATHTLAGRHITPTRSRGAQPRLQVQRTRGRASMGGERLAAATLPPRSTTLGEQLRLPVGGTEPGPNVGPRSTDVVTTYKSAPGDTHIPAIDDVEAGTAERPLGQPTLQMSESRLNRITTWRQEASRLTATGGRNSPLGPRAAGNVASAGGSPTPSRGQSVLRGGALGTTDGATGPSTAPATMGRMSSTDGVPARSGTRPGNSKGVEWPALIRPSLDVSSLGQHGGPELTVRPGHQSYPGQRVSSPGPQPSSPLANVAPHPWDDDTGSPRRLAAVHQASSPLASVGGLPKAMSKRILNQWPSARVRPTDEAQLPGATGEPPRVPGGSGATTPTGGTPGYASPVTQPAPPALVGAGFSPATAPPRRALGPTTAAAEWAGSPMGRSSLRGSDACLRDAWHMDATEVVAAGASFTAVDTLTPSTTHQQSYMPVQRNNLMQGSPSSGAGNTGPEDSGGTHSGTLFHWPANPPQARAPAAVSVTPTASVMQGRRMVHPPPSSPDSPPPNLAGMRSGSGPF